MFDNKKIQFGIAPIAWTNDDMPQLGNENTFEQCISEAALAGFQGTEVGIKYPADAETLKKAMDLRGLSVCSKWFSSFLCTTSYEENEREFLKELAYLEALGSKRINVCELSHNLFAEKTSMFGEHKPIADDKEWDKLCEGLNRLGKIAVSRGFKLCYHHHMATVVQTIEETKRLMDNTDPNYVFLCFDTGHFTFSSENAVKAAELFAKRTGHVHLKDIRAEKMQTAIKEGYFFRQSVLEGCFTIPGDGCVDFKSVLEILDQAGYEGWLLVEAEQDPAIANPFTYALMARKYLREVTGI